MITVETREQIRRAYFHEHKTIRQIAREVRCSRKSVHKAIQSAEPAAYTLKVPRAFPVLGPYKSMIEQLLVENERMPRKQRYTEHTIFKMLQAQGYAGSEPPCGGMWRSVGFDRRNFLVPIPQVASFEALNAHLLTQCLADDQRQVTGQATSMGEAWRVEQPCLRPLPARAFDGCVIRPATLTPYSQVVFETNRYSVPADAAYPQLGIKAYPVRLEILHLDRVLARHPRGYGWEQDIFDPLHDLPVLEQRPGAFEHAKPIRRWREGWPPVYEALLARLRADGRDGHGVRAFVRILRLHREHPADQIEQAICLALEPGCLHADGVARCLHQLQHPPAPVPSLDLTTRSWLAPVGAQPVAVSRYEQLLTGREP